MRVTLIGFLVVTYTLGQGIVPNSWLCDWIGVEGASKELRNKYKSLITSLNKDKTLKAQQTRVGTWIKANAKELPELNERIEMTVSNKVMIPNLMVPDDGPVAVSRLALDASDSSSNIASYKQPEPVDKQVVDNAIYNARYWLGMRARDVRMINDILQRIGTQLSGDKLDEIKKMIWTQDRENLNFYRPHYDVLKAQILGTISNSARREAVRVLLEEAEALDDDSEPAHALMPLMEPLASEFFIGCGI